MGIRILVIEDETTIVDFLIRGLSEEEYVVEHAADGGTGWSMLRSGEWDLVILDWWLPDQDGLTLLQIGRRTPVLFLTARDAVSDRVRGLDAGADDYLAKPFAFEELLARVRAQVRRRDAADNTTISHRDVRVDLAAQRAERAGHALPLISAGLRRAAGDGTRHPVSRGRRRAGKGRMGTGLQAPGCERALARRPCAVGGLRWSSPRLMAALAGRRLCDRALLPVTRMASAACLMNAVDRDQRRPSPATGDELDALASAFNGRLDNACKYSALGTAISVKVWRDQGNIALAVMDHGFGLSGDDISQVFEPFFRSSDARRRGQAGVGLGLAVVERIMAVLGGTSTAESTPGQGTQFTLRLPEVSAPTDLALDTNPGLLESLELR